jgi:hypothetical protein
MKTIKFGFFGEDLAHKIFLINYLNHFQKSHNLLFEIDEEFCYRYSGNNKKEVDNRIGEVIQAGFNYPYNQDVFFVGRDIDSQNIAERDKISSQLKSKIWSQYQTKALIFLPIQCIEHWLCYIKWNKENSSQTKNITFENIGNNDTKFQVYQVKKASNSISIPIVKNLTENFDIQWLESRSESFRHFHNQVIEFVKNS